MIGFRHADPRFPFLWEAPDQPAARWHGAGEGPVHYFADTPDGAWAEFLRHEEITAPEDLETVSRAIWAVDLPDDGYAEPRLPGETLEGGPGTYEACQAETRRLVASGATGLRAPTAALQAGAAAGWRVDAGLQPAPQRNGHTLALFGRRPDLIGWCAAAHGRPAPELLKKVRPLRGPDEGGSSSSRSQMPKRPAST